MRASLAILALASCSADLPVVAPIVDVPAAGSDADPWTDVDLLAMTVTEDGVPLLEESFERGDTVRIDGAPLGPGVAVHLTGRASAAGGALQDVSYGRTCTFDTTSDAEIHLWFSHIVRWAPFGAAGSPEGSPSAPLRTDGFAFTDDDGGVAFVSGSATSIDRFDARAGAFESVVASTLERHGGKMAAFTERSVLLVGGTASADPLPTEAPIGTLEAVAPTADLAGQLQTLDDPRIALVDHSVTSLVGGGAFVAGGRTSPMGAPSNLAYEVAPGPGDSPEVRLINQTMNVARAGHSATRLGDEVGADIIIIGGVDELAELVLPAELYEPLSEQFAPPTAFDAVLPLPLARRDHLALGLPDDTILIIGGVGRDPATMEELPRRELVVYDPHLQQFTEVASLPGDAGYLDFTATPLADGRILLAGGLGGDLPGSPIDTVYIAEFNPMTGSVTLLRTDPLTAPRAGHSAALLCDGTVLLVGGTTGTGAPPAERYNPPPAGRL